MRKQYYVTYRNRGKPEKTPVMSQDKARASAEFLKFQGATSVRVRSKPTNLERT